MPAVEHATVSRRDRQLGDLLSSAGYPAQPDLQSVRVGRIVADSREVEPGDLFVALVGSDTDGHDYLPEVIAAGAVAVVVERDVGPEPMGAPVIVVNDTREALARLSATWYGNPAEQLRLIGITGTLGKTTVLSMLESILIEAKVGIGTIGSLGVRVDGRSEETGYTAPDPLILHDALARFLQSGVSLVAMEVTTHALTQQRVHGLRYRLGIFTNLVPLEHLEYHGSFRKYVEAKVRFFDHLPAGVPIIYSYDDRAVRGVVRRHDLVRVGVGEARGAEVRYEMQETTSRGSSFSLVSRAPIPDLAGGRLEPFELEIQLRAIGRSMVENAALAATAALLAGASPGSVREALAGYPPPKRRLQVLREDPFLVLDDTAGHPDSVGMVFDVVERLDRDRVHAVFAVRGQRGERINRGTAEALAIWSAHTPLQTLIVTTSDDTADELNRVTPAEREAFLSELRDAGIEFQERSRLDEAVDLLVDRAGPGDLVLLLGAQGMDDGARLLEARLGA